MLFHLFQSQSERRNFGGSDFIEIQYCRMPQESTICEIVNLDHIEHWKNDSLYVYGDDTDIFYQNYESILTGGIYNNLESGPVDLFGINFYSHEQVPLILERIKTERPKDYKIFQDWLGEGKQYIGFYVLGV